MTDRISDERLAELVTLTNSYSPENHVLLHGETSLQVCAALRELQERREDANYDIKVKLGLMDGAP